MNPCDKLKLLNEQIRPFGFSYDICKDIFITAEDAWQNDFGYRELYDRAAPHLHMVFDCEPVYFNYNGQTWLIEFWKGQYGINTGGEIGIYRADRLLTPKQYPHAQFNSLPEGNLFPMSMKLDVQNQTLFSLQKPHRWLAGFRMGIFSEPKDLNMHVSLTFPTISMLRSFVGSLHELGYGPCDLCICDLTVMFTLSRPHTRRHGLFLRFQSKLAQWENRLFIRLFLHVTQPFTCTTDRLLYLYYFLPFAFRRIFSVTKFPHKRKYLTSFFRHTGIKRKNI